LNETELRTKIEAIIYKKSELLKTKDLNLHLANKIITMIYHKLDSEETSLDDLALCSDMFLTLSTAIEKSTKENGILLMEL